MRKIGVLGGTFNPPHIGHLIMANEALFKLGLDEVRLMPNAVAPHKEVAGADAAQRLEMTRLAASGYPGIEVEAFEIEKGGVSYSVDTMQQLTDREPDAVFYFLIGGDMIEGLTDWHRIDDLLKIVTFAGFRRPGYNEETAYPVTLVDAPELKLSSTFLRERIAAGGPVAHLIPDAVEQFIRKEHLYGS
ncbi:nicotinate-nucleotide adenylyltransferase [Planococcus lenghuensis]|uniref:Probable nicotinate-nucleotide adenylyltransferase n=1 Tax=Planococcus lenghuensis TaxID=2213202 RepID=A0A1Q2KXK2_9BACL|nr:nicotinate-nucleotide adenylyltransferase [Planococcus lenghuensis]AQQ52945.1 nicotinate-nucleotide adenylyltransferase [Planococcus lenghuensis]